MGKKKLMKQVLSKAAEKGLTPAQIVNQSIKLDQLEKKYSKSFQDLKIEFEALQKKIEEKSKTLKEIDQTIAMAEKKRSDLMRQYMLDEKRVREYVDARERLSPIGFPVDDMSRVKTFLLSLKNEEYNPDKIVEKLNTIGDLEQRKNALETELGSTNADLRENKALLVEVRKLQQTGLSIDHIESIRDTVSKISSRRGISGEEAMNQFESDVLKNYDLSLGLESEILRLRETKASLASEFEERKRGFEAKEKSILDRIRDLETKHQSQKEEIKACSELKALGIDGKRIVSWNEIVSNNKLDYGVIESELKKQGNLRALEEDAEKRIEELQKQEGLLSASVSELSEQKSAFESSITAIKEQTLKELEISRADILASVSQVTEEVRQASESTKNDLNVTLSELKSAATGFSGDIAGNLRRLEESASKTIETFQDQAVALATSVSEQKQFLESSVASIENMIVKELEASRSSLAASVSQMTAESFERNMSTYAQRVDSLENELVTLPSRLEKIEGSLTALLQELTQKKEEKKEMATPDARPAQRPADDDGRF